VQESRNHLKIYYLVQRYSKNEKVEKFQFTIILDNLVKTDAMKCDEK
jgi:hypothetical protein